MDRPSARPRVGPLVGPARGRLVARRTTYWKRTVIAWENFEGLGASRYQYWKFQV